MDVYLHSPKELSSLTPFAVIVLVFKNKNRDNFVLHVRGRKQDIHITSGVDVDSGSGVNFVEYSGLALLLI